MQTSAISKIRLAHIIGFLGLGGMELGVIRQSNALCKNGFDITIIYFDSKQPEAEALLDTKVETIQVKRQPGIDWRLILKLAKVLKEQKIDIVHAHNWTTFLYGVMAARLAKVPVIIQGEHGRDTDEYERDWKKLWVRRFLTVQCDHLTAVSTDIVEILTGIWKVTRKKISFLPNGVDLDKFRPVKDRRKAKKAIGINADVPVVGTVIGAFRPIKGLPVLLQAFKHVHKMMPDAQLLIIGDGESRQEMEDFAMEMGIYNSTLFLGKRSDIPEILSTMDIYINCSLYEGMSNTILESLACGVPVVATEVGGTPRILHYGKYGVLIPQNSPDDMGKAICELFQDHEKRAALSRTGRQYIERYYSFEQTIKKYESLYKRLFARKVQTRKGLKGHLTHRKRTPTECLEKYSVEKNALS